MQWRPAYTEAEVRDAVDNAASLSGALRRMGLRPVGGNFGTLKRLIAHYGISTDHFDPNWNASTACPTTPSENGFAGIAPRPAGDGGEEAAA
jgi:hypothetical protein